MTKFLVLNNLVQLECYVAGYSNTIGLSLRRSLVLSGHCAALALIHHLLLRLEKAVLQANQNFDSSASIKNYCGAKYS